MHKSHKNNRKMQNVSREKKHQYEKYKNTNRMSKKLKMT